MSTLQGKRVFVSGGAGFIGSRLIQRIVDDCEVVVFDTMHRNALKALGLSEHKNVTLVKGDVQDAPAIVDAMQGCDLVVHMAGIAGIDTVIKNPAQTMHVNMSGAANMLEAARKLKRLERYVNFSTSEVFGHYTFKESESAWTTTGVVGEARWSYAVSKLAAEHLTYAYYHQYKLPTVTVRPFNIYGPGQVGEGAVHVFVSRALKGEPLEIHGDGNQIRSWTYIDDMVDGILLCLTHDKAVGQAFSIGNPHGAITIHFLAKIIKQLANSSSTISHVPKLSEDVELRVPNIDKARQTLGFSPKVDLEEGLQKTINWYRDQQ